MGFVRAVIVSLCLLLGWGFGARAAVPPGPEAGSTVTCYGRMTAGLRTEAAHCPFVRLVSIGKSGREHKDLWLVRVADPAADPAATIRLLVLCRQHGDEPAATEGVLSLIRRVAEGGDPALRASLRHVTLYFVPMVNPEGADAGARHNRAGADLNRDWGMFAQPETQAVARAVAVLRPHILVDAHNWDSGDPYNADCLEVARDRTDRLSRISLALQAASIAHLAHLGYSVHPTAYGPWADPRLAHRYFARRGLVALLIETHSGPVGDQTDFQRRQGLYVALIHGLAESFAAHWASERPRLDALENYAGRPSLEARLFAPQPVRQVAVSPRPVPRRPLIWLWALGLYGLTLWAAGLRGGLCPLRNWRPGTGAAPIPVFVPASARRSAGRLDRRRYQC